MDQNTLSAETSDYVTPAQAGRLLGVSKRTIHNWMMRGLFKAWQTEGGHYHIARTSINAILSKREAALAGQSTHKPTGKMSLLIVEDDEVLLSSYVEVFKNWQLPIDILTADNGFDGLILAGYHKPDMLLADLMTPLMDGFQMIRSIRRNSRLHHCSIVVITSLTAEKIAERGGLDANIPILHKPISFGQLRSIVEQQLDRS
ncbi:MAG: response regulator [Magnetococcales bacterium]|nr:response regulator [Magnetococcales bacterium]